MTSHQDVDSSDASLDDIPLVFGITQSDRGEVRILREFMEDFVDEEPSGVLEVSVSEIAEPFGGLETLLDNPSYHLHFLTGVVGEMGYDDLHVTGQVPGSHKTVEELRAKDIGQLVSIEARVTKRDKNRTRHMIAEFQCMRCMDVVEVRQSRASGDIEYPSECQSDSCNNSAKKGFEHNTEEGEVVDRQQLIIQDLHANSSTANPSDARVDVHNLLVNQAESGETVTLTGILRATEDEAKDSELYVQALGFEHHDRGYSGVDLTEADKEENREIADSDDVYETLASSIAPSIKGDYRMARMAGLCQLVGGVRRQTDDQKERENIHVAYVGDPGTGKSDLAKYIAKIAPKSVYQSADNASEVGITASISYEDKFDSTKATLTGGALVEADGGMCVLDELDKGSEGVRNCLQEPLEAQEVSVAKHDIRATLPTRCGVMLVANPVNSRFDMDQNLQNQMNLNEVIWDRMDVIVPFVNEPDEDVDKDIADSVLNRAKGKTEDYISPEKMQKYVAHARSIDPEMTDVAHELIKDAWVEWRSGATKYRTPVGVRQLYSAVRLSEAFARLRLGDTVTEDDAEQAVQLMEAWMYQMMTNERGQLDVDVLSGESSTKRETLSVVKSTIDEYGDDGEMHRNEVVQIVNRDLGGEKQDLQQKINGYIGAPDKSGIEQNDGMLVRVNE